MVTVAVAGSDTMLTANAEELHMTFSLLLSVYTGGDIIRLALILSSNLYRK
jgi:hypothetical protein